MKMNSLATLILTVAAWASVSGQAFAGTVVFADTTIDARVRSLISKPRPDPIDSADLIGVTELDVSGFLIEDLGGVEFLVNMLTLNLSDNAIVDIAPLSGLVKIVSLDLSGNLIEDVSPLVDLDKLRNVDLSTNEIRDLTPLLDNDGLGLGDDLNVLDNPLLQSSICDVILPLVADGVDVEYEGTCPGAVSGKVTELSGDPVEGAFVFASATGTSPGIGPVSFDGEFYISGLDPGTYTLSVHAPGYERKFQLGVSVRDSAVSETRINLVTLTRTDVIRAPGTVKDSLTGLPLIGAVVGVFAGSRPVDTTHSNSEGKFEIHLSEVETQVMGIDVSAPGYATAHFSLDPAAVTLTNAVLVPTASNNPAVLNGTVYDGAAATPVGLPGARIIVKPDGGLLAFGGTSASNGSFQVENLLVGEYSIQVSSLAYPGDGELRPIVIVEGENVFPITIGSISVCGAGGTAGSGGLPRPGDIVVVLGTVLAMIYARPRFARASSAAR